MMHLTEKLPSKDRRWPAPAIPRPKRAFLPGLLATALVWMCVRALGSSPDVQLVDAARNGDSADVRDALAAGARINTQKGPSALFTCLGSQAADSLQMVQLLLDLGADVNTPGPEGPSAFQTVLQGWNIDDYLPLFLPHHPDLNAKDRDGNGVVALAIRRGALPAARLLLDRGSPGDDPNTAGVTPLMLLAQGDRNQAWRESEYLDLAKLLVVKGADIHRLDKAEKSAAAYAFEAHNYDLLLLLDSSQAYAAKYAAVKMADQNQKLSATVEKHRWSQVRIIGGPKTPPIDTMGIITKLLDEGADPNSPSNEQTTTIFGQALGDVRGGAPALPDPDVIRLLLNHGAHPNQPLPDGNVPLSLAVAYDDVFALLLDSGANSEAMVELSAPTINPVTGGLVQGNQKQSILQLVASGGAVATMKRMLENKPDLEQADSEGMTPLLTAIAQGNTDVARLLIAHGARTDGKNKQGQSAADLAATALDIGLLRQLDRDGRHTALLSEYPPSSDETVTGDWLIGSSDVSAPLRLDADGCGVLALFGNPRAIAWKSAGNGYDLTGIRTTGRFAIPTPFKADLTLDSSGKLLTFRPASQPGQGTYVLIFHRRGTPAPAQSELQAPAAPPSVGADQIASTIAEALIASPQNLSLNQSDMTAFPTAAFQMIGLSRLSINNTKLESIPGEVGRFRLLENVSLRANRISVLGEGFWDLENLTQVDLGMNLLKSLSPRLCQLAKVTDLMLDDNRIGTLPEGWEKMAGLKTLTLGGNRLVKLPVSLARAPQLASLSLNDNMLSDLPREWGKFALDYLDLSNNRFTTFPAELKDIQIRRLNLGGNEITDIPANIIASAGFVELDLSRNLITSIPDLSRTRLTQLRLSDNQIKILPASREALPPTLRELDLSRNQITSIPDWIFDLNLQDLNLSGNPMPEETLRSAEQRVRQAWMTHRQTGGH